MPKIINSTILWAEPDDIPPMRICCVCGLILEHGSLPASHGYCDACAADAMRQVDEYSDKKGGEINGREN